MKSIRHLTIFLWLFFTFSTITYAIEPLPKNLIPFTSPSAAPLLKDNLSENLSKLLSHFITQKTVTYCGVASTVMILNASGINPPLDSLHSPYHYFTQDDFFNAEVKKIITEEEVLKKGITLTQLSKVIKSYGLQAKAYFANELTLDKARQLLKNALLNQQFIIVNFLRAELQQAGGGHHSPIAAYDIKTDRFLLLDVARYKYPAYWVKTEDLWKAMNTKDEDKYRGFILISPH